MVLPPRRDRQTQKGQNAYAAPSLQDCLLEFKRYLVGKALGAVSFFVLSTFSLRVIRAESPFRKFTLEIDSFSVAEQHSFKPAAENFDWAIVSSFGSRRPGKPVHAVGEPGDRIWHSR